MSTENYPRTFQESKWLANDDETSDEIDPKSDDIPKENSLCSLNVSLETKGFRNDYNIEIIEYYKGIDAKYKYDNEIVRKIQKHTVDSDRERVVAWVIEIGKQFSVPTDTIFNSIKLFDILLTNVQISVDDLYLHSAACLLLSSKVYDSPDLDLFSKLCQDSDRISEAALMTDELDIFQKLNFNASNINTSSFIRYYLHNSIPSVNQDKCIKIWECSRIIALCALCKTNCCAYSDEVKAITSIVIACNALGYDFPKIDINQQSMIDIKNAVKIMLEKPNCFLSSNFADISEFLRSSL